MLLGHWLTLTPKSQVLQRSSTLVARNLLVWGLGEGKQVGIRDTWSPYHAPKRVLQRVPTNALQHNQKS